MIWPVSRDWKPSEAPPDILILEEQAVKLAEGGAVYHDPTHVSRVAAITPTDSPNFSRKKAAGNTNRTYTICKSMSKRIRRARNTTMLQLVRLSARSELT